MAEDESHILAGKAKRKEVGGYWSVTAKGNSDAFGIGLGLVQAIRRAFHDDITWNSMSLKERYKFLDEIEKILRNPGANTNNYIYRIVKDVIYKAATSTGASLDLLEESALMAVSTLKKRRGSEAQIARMGESRLAQRRQARNVQTYWAEAKRMKAAGASKKEIEKRIKEELDRDLPKADDSERERTAKKIAESADKSDREWEEQAAADEENERAEAYRKSSHRSSENDNAEYWNEDWYHTADPEDQWMTPPGFGPSPSPSYGPSPSPSFGPSTSPSTSPGEEGSGKKCPGEVTKLGKEIIARMPETAFEGVWTVFKNYPTVQGWIKSKKYDESLLRSCLWDVYRSHYEGERGKIHGTKWNPFTPRGVRREGFRKALGYKVPKYGLTGSAEGYKMIRDPLLRSAINKGKRLLRKAARDYYKYVYDNANQKLEEFKKKEEKAKASVEKAEQNYMKALQKAHSHANMLRNKRGQDPLDNLPTKIEDIGNITGLISKTLGAAGRDDQNAVAYRTDVEEYRHIYEEAKQEFEKIDAKSQELIKEFDPKNFYASMKTALEKVADDQAGKLGASLSVGGGTEYWRYGESRHPAASAEAGLKRDVIKGALSEEVEYLARYYGRRIQRRWKTKLPALRMGFRSLSESSQTFGEAWTQLLHNLWNFIFGPWTIGTIFVLIQFFFTLSYIGYNLQFLYVMPVIAAAFTFLLNFTDTTRPFDWVTHLASGAMIGYSAEFFLIALGANTWSFIAGTASAGFWIAWAILVFIGIFQFYQT